MCPPGVISGRNLSRVSPPESGLFDIDWQFDMFSEGLYVYCVWLIWFYVCPPGGSCEGNLSGVFICVFCLWLIWFLVCPPDGSYVLRISSD